MKHTLKTYITLSLLLFSMSWANVNWAQNMSIDSLLIRYKKERVDTVKINLLYNLSWEYQRTSMFDSCIKYARIGIDLAKKVDKEQQTARFYNCMGVAYKNRGFYSKAIENYITAIKIAEKHKDTARISSVLINTGSLYLIQNRYSEAEKTFSRALALTKVEGNKKRISQIYTGFGEIYRSQKKYKLSLGFYLKALEKSRELENAEYIVSCLENIGVIYHEQKKYTEAINYYSDALAIVENRKQKADLYGNMGQVNFSVENYNESEKYFLKAIEQFDSIGELAQKVPVLFGISHIYEKRGDIEKAFAFYKQAIATKDSLYKRNKLEEGTRQEMNYEFEKKEQEIKTENEKKNYKQRLLIWSISIGLVLVLIFTFFVLRAISITKKQKQIIELQNKKTEKQKEIIEEKNKNIMDSIHYAKRIQRALLREENHISKHLPEHFILFLPKDVVSGDFYWAVEKQEYWYFAVADCTGHGVPGAIMSMLGISFLNEIVLSQELLSPNEILNELRDKIVIELRQADETIGNKDGMDISLCRLNLKTLELEWAGANNALNIIKNNTLQEIKADKQPIGYYPLSKPFTNHQIQLQKGDCIYIYSDGYPDQFGGAKGKKLTYKRFENILLENHTLNLDTQKNKLKLYFSEWQGALEQVDDVCIVGIRV
ncbi:MAG: tetratricopeptide repeat protein [Bacteroidia bacterium]